MNFHGSNLLESIFFLGANRSRRAYDRCVGWWADHKNMVAAHQKAEIIRLSPRILLEEQRSSLRSHLSSRTGKIGFIARLMDGEGTDYAEALAAIFRDAGWQVVPTMKNFVGDFSGFVTLAVTGNDLGDLANFVGESLNAVGIICKPYELAENQIGGVRQPDTIYVIVGRK